MINRFFFCVLWVGLVAFANAANSVYIASSLPTNTAESDTVKTKTAKKGGLLGSLFPVEEDEAIHRGNFLTGATLFLLQGNSDDDALNILFGDIYKAEGYTFTAEAFGG